MLLFTVRQISKTMFNVLRLTSMTLNRSLEGEGCQIVHEAGFHSKTPKRHRSELLGRILRARLNDSIARAYVMQ